MDESVFIRETKIIYYGKPRKAVVIKSPKNVYEFLKDYENYTEERFVALFLNIRNAIIGWQEITKGTMTETLVSAREVFRPAVISGAVAIIVAHNHPAGDVKISDQDISTTQKLKEAGDILNIKLLDHVIIGFKQWVSLREEYHL